MDPYHQKALQELEIWQKAMMKKPSLFQKYSRNIQKRINQIIPEKVHQTITTVIRQMVHVALFSAKYRQHLDLSAFSSLQKREEKILEKIAFYKKMAGVEGGITGAGGFMLGLADFPLLLFLKINLLFDIAHGYGFQTTSYQERLFLLHIFQLAFSSDEQRKKIYVHLAHWDENVHLLPQDIRDFDWRTFQQEYRDTLDIVKFAQLLPVIGAPVGYVVNRRLINKLGITAMNCYRMRKKKDFFS